MSAIDRGAEMVKPLAVFLILILSYMFYPFWDLYIREDPFSTVYNPAGKGFWRRDHCVDAASAVNAYDYRCRRRTNFESLLGAGRKKGVGKSEIEG